jgi:hypothetical protein
MHIDTVIEKHGWIGVAARPEATGPGDLLKVIADGDRTLAVVVDPKGGIGGGEEVSGLVDGSLDPASVHRIDDVADLSQILSRWDQELETNRKAGEASLALILTTPRRVLAVSIGDSEVWVKSPRHFKKLCGRKKFGSGYELGTGCLLLEAGMWPGAEVEWAAVMSDGCARHLEVLSLEHQLADRNQPALAVLDELRRSRGAFLLDSLSYALWHGRGAAGRVP